MGVDVGDLVMPCHATLCHAMAAASRFTYIDRRI